MGNAGEQIREFWQGMSPAQRWLMVGGTVALTLALVLASNFLTQGPAMGPVFTNLAPTDAASIVSYLDKQGIQYRLADNGKTIEVPQDQVARTRLEIAGQGLPKDGVVGLESLNNLPFGATSFSQHVAYLRALQGELTRTIESINEVKSARVHIVLPQQSAFVSQQQPSSAAVLVEMKPGASMNPQQVSAIMHLVASSVQNLDPSAVTVVDSSGQILSNQVASSNGGSFSAGSQFTQTQQFEQKLDQEVTALLEPVFGPGNVKVQSTADLNFDQKKVSQTLFSPVNKSSNQGIVRSVQQLKETYQTQGAAGSGGVPGTSSNTQNLPPGYPGNSANSSGNQSNYNKSQNTTNYEINQEDTTQVIAPGAVQRLTMAVVINANLSQQQVQQVQQIVQAAIGYDASRKDVINVQGLQFSNSLVSSLKNQPASQANAASKTSSKLPYQQYWPFAAAGLGLVLLGGGWLVIGGRRRRRQEHEQELLEAQLQALESDERRQERERPDPVDQEAREALEQMARTDPEQVARVVRSWLLED